MAAARAYDEEARRRQGARAIVNFSDRWRTPAGSWTSGPSSLDIEPVRPVKPLKPAAPKPVTLSKPAAAGRRPKSSQYRGVSIRESGRWTARIKHNHKDIVIGRFDTEATISRLTLILVRNISPSP